MKFTDKVVVITGGASGIGRATAIKFARAGASVVVADINEQQGNETVSSIEQNGDTAAFCQVDVTNFASVEALVNFAVERFGHIHVMCNNAGIGDSAPLLQHEPELFDRVIKVNQYGVYYGILAAARKMKDLDIQGVIINTCSIYGFLASPNVISYHASKGAVKMMTQAAALELAPYGIRVVGVAPGIVDTPIIQGYRDRGMIDMLANKEMKRKLQEPEEIADAIFLLAQDEARSINGSIVMTDGGYAEFK
jgi:NAD(P)-dependent dehydrogenase (short-subunit alcohol dehydrogenase family)